MVRRKLFRQGKAEPGLPHTAGLARCSPISQLAAAVRRLGRVELAVLCAIAAMLLPPALSAQAKSARLNGVVRDSAGKAVGHAHVALRQEKSQRLRETTADADGHFTFQGVATGVYILTASSGEERSSAVSITVSKPGDQPRIDLSLDAPAQRPAVAGTYAGQAMQFADSPNFAIAAVTDWTAAGGHGSDASLRTSEALTREAVMLLPNGSKTTAAPPVRAHDSAQSEEALRAAVAKDPGGFNTNSRLGNFYLRSGRYRDAIKPLQIAYAASPANFENEYNLARALARAGEAAQARKHVQHLMARHPSADLHRMDGELEEKLGDPLAAVREFQEAASENPSEENYFAWGSELLFHRAIWQAKEVFDEGAKLYPRSARMLTARGAALFAGALYDQAALDLCRASDLNPHNAKPYLFMGKIEIAAPNPLPCVVSKLKRFQQLQPTNALANYYYAMALVKQRGHAADPRTMQDVTAMLVHAVNLDPKCADGYLELGNLSADKKEWEQAVAYYRKAIQSNPDLSEAYYRLGVAYEHTGNQSRAKEQFQLHDAIAKREAAEIQRQRLAVKQFVVLPDPRGKQETQH